MKFKTKDTVDLATPSPLPPLQNLPTNFKLLNPYTNSLNNKSFLVLKNTEITDVMEDSEMDLSLMLLKTELPLNKLSLTFLEPMPKFPPVLLNTENTPLDLTTTLLDLDTVLESKPTLLTNLYTLELLLTTGNSTKEESLITAPMMLIQSTTP